MFFIIENIIKVKNNLNSVAYLMRNKLKIIKINRKKEKIAQKYKKYDIINKT
jgi:hypothetical protein